MRWNTVQNCLLPTPQPHQLQHSGLRPLLILGMQGNNPSPPRTEYVPATDVAQNKMPLLRNRQEKIAERNRLSGQTMCQVECPGQEMQSF